MPIAGIRKKVDISQLAIEQQNELLAGEERWEIKNENGIRLNGIRFKMVNIYMMAQRVERTHVS